VRPIRVQKLGRVEYADGLELMRRAAEQVRQRDPDADWLFLVEHPPVLTLGRGAGRGNVLASPGWLESRGFEIHETDRGGDVTYHGPGQLVGYPIVDLGRRPDLAGFLSRMEEMIIAVGADLGLDLSHDPLQAGVWSGSSKVCAMGVRLTRWRVTSHGFGLNCDTDLTWFDAIVPCGLADRSVTSLSEVAGRTVTVADVRPLVHRSYEEAFATTLEPAPSDISELFAAGARL